MNEINYNRLFIADTETTRFLENRIVSLAYIYCENGKRIAQDYILVNPQAKIEEGASKVNGITYDKIKNCPTFDKVWESISAYMTNSVWVFHNSNYDELKVIIPELKRYNIPVPSHRVCCTLENAKLLIPKKEVKNYKLGTLCEYFGIDLGDRFHEADFDTEACARIFNRLIRISNGNLNTKERLKGE